MNGPVDVLKLIRSSSAIIGNLPALPDFNGSILMIDDDEASRIERDLDEATAAVAELIEAGTAITAMSIMSYCGCETCTAMKRFSTAIAAATGENV